MAFCPNCGTPHRDDALFCASCGTRLGASAPPPKAESGGLIDQIKNAPDHTADFDSTDISQNKALAILSYIGILVLIPIFCAKHSKFARFHANQGLILVIATAAVNVANCIFTALTYAWWPFVLLEIPVALLSLAMTALMVLGIINAARGKAKELPFIGKYRILK